MGFLQMQMVIRPENAIKTVGFPAQMSPVQQGGGLGQMDCKLYIIASIRPWGSTRGRKSTAPTGKSVNLGINQSRNRLPMCANHEVDFSLFGVN